MTDLAYLLLGIVIGGTVTYELVTWLRADPPGPVIETTILTIDRESGEVIYP